MLDLIPRYELKGLLCLLCVDMLDDVFERRQGRNGRERSFFVYYQ